MKQTRRGFVGTAAAIGAVSLLPAPLWAQTRPVRISLAEFSRDPARVASLRKGVAVMKARPPSDHRSWFYQAAIHAYNDAAYADALTRDAAVAQVDSARFWNKCPHFGQSSADFLIWHRAYLFQFERVLRDAAGDPMLALPYWDYSKPEDRGFPAIFADKKLPDGTPNPLYHPNREEAFVTGRFDISPEVGEADATMAARTFFSDIGAPGLAGDILDSKHTQLGLIEQRPHNDIHIAVGGVIGSANGAMADVPTAAFDPVFWVHHANIDRLWAQWSAMPGKDWGPLPPSEWFDEEPWEFVGVDGAVARASRRFFIDRANLGVFYDTDHLHGSPLALPPPPVGAALPPPGAGAPTAGAAAEDHATKSAPSQEVVVVSASAHGETEMLADTKPLTLSPSGAVARNLEEAALASRPVGSAGHHMAARPRAPGRVVLELDDIAFSRVPSSGFAVYLASADDLMAGRKGTLVGLIDLFGMTHAHMAGMERMGATQRFDVTGIVAREGLALTLRIEPYSLLVSKAGGAAPARADSVKIGRVRFLETS